ncbi:hypothetical protein [Azospirillum sp. TSH64]|uniref:hypothetical protein n=1 Tax=Azospirillum sp. TSH64 TaxID=652740 RepID=UPI0013049C49|nr:hypothetical protein [Azospirillum sp. TSH64]
MISITFNQIEEFYKSSLENFRTRTFNYLSNSNKEKLSGISYHEYCIIVDRVIEKSAPFDLRSERDLFLFLSFIFEFGEDFAAAPEMDWLRSILRDPLPMKMERIFDAALLRFRPPPSNVKVKGIQGGIHAN